MSDKNTKKRNGPLSNARVIDLGTRVAAPHCATMLAEFGADVIKVEVPGRGDPYRYIGTTLEGDEDSLSFLNDNRNKRSLTLDLRNARGKEIFKRLVKTADFLVENFRPGTLETWELGPDELKKINPRLIVVRVSAYGQTGPYHKRSGVALVAYGFSGISYLCGTSDAPPGQPGTQALGDYLAGQMATIGALLAYISRGQQGSGQVVDVSLYESILRLLDELVPAYKSTGFIRQREGATSPHTVPSNHYLTLDGKWVAVSAASQDIFERLCHAMNRGELANRYPSGAARLAGRQELDAVVADWIKTVTREELIRISDDFSFPAGPVLNVQDIAENEHVLARGTLQSVVNNGKEITVVGTCPRLSLTPGQVEQLGPSLGKHTDEILSELGFTLDEVADFRSAKVI